MDELIVLKVGGSLGVKHFNILISAIRSVQQQGAKAVLVHGGGPRITQALSDENISLPFFAGQRMTTVAAMDVVERVLVQEVNAEMVHALNVAGLSAVGISGATGVIEAVPVPNMERTGRVVDIDVQPLSEILSRNTIPVVAPIGRGRDGLHFNINADLSASKLAGALAAKRMIFLTDVDGIYEDFEAKLRLDYATYEHLARLMQTGCFTAGMIPKVEAVLSALDAGIEAVYVVAGYDAHAVLWATSSHVGDHSVALGTCVTQS